MENVETPEFMRAGSSVNGDLSILPGMTPAEGRVLELVVAGLSNEEIGGRLHISRGTVKAQVASLLLKFGVRNRVQLAVAAISCGVMGG